MSATSLSEIASSSSSPLLPSPHIPRPAFNKKSHARKKAPGHIPRPRNPFILFRCALGYQRCVPPGIRAQEVSKYAAVLWNGLSDEQREPWLQLGEEEKLQWREKHFTEETSPKKRKSERGTRVQRPVASVPYDSQPQLFDFEAMLDNSMSYDFPFPTDRSFFDLSNQSYNDSFPSLGSSELYSLENLDFGFPIFEFDTNPYQYSTVFTPTPTESSSSSPAPEMCNFPAPFNYPLGLDYNYQYELSSSGCL